MTNTNILSIVPTSLLASKDKSVILNTDTLGLRGSLKFSPNEHLFFQGDAPTGVFQVLSGTVIFYKLLPDGRRQIQNFATTGDVLALTFSDEHDVSAEALTNTEVLFIPQAKLDRALQEDVEFRRRIFTIISEMLQSAREQALLLGRKNAMERTASFLLFLHARFADPRSGYAKIPMSRCDISDYLGLTVETVSRMMNRLKKLGVIDLPQATEFKVLDTTKLLQMTGDTENTRDFKHG